ncbi:hypothetical protein [Pseudomonas aeruginosa]|uniref:hypothetical protein n=1 Tax=Pseudomonas aeruginosa TaxID=287 RepID=UPI000F52831C|nr:hypothetical protein [Pseudomonas aeruginosa]MCS8370180.1 hypothetical protein [Pseudomonas aeruginosa]HBO4439301.1 hypothetical protein [Pseudomonas aeruginosa]HCR1533429.1 hypothetical protein [Pseudomonas aeruginosa]HEJ2004452.1 hypothetical protein [Pseudomonas aeruginosa]
MDREYVGYVIHEARPTLLRVDVDEKLPLVEVERLLGQVELVRWNNPYFWPSLFAKRELLPIRNHGKDAELLIGEGLGDCEQVIGLCWLEVGLEDQVGEEAGYVLQFLPLVLLLGGQ